MKCPQCNESQLREDVECYMIYCDLCGASWNKGVFIQQYGDPKIDIVPEENKIKIKPTYDELVEILEGERDAHDIELAYKENDLQELREAFDLVGKWLSAAQDDPKVCDAMKADITKAFEVRG